MATVPTGQGTEDNEHGLAPVMNGQWSKDKTTEAKTARMNLAVQTNTPRSQCASTREWGLLSGRA